MPISLQAEINFDKSLADLRNLEPASVPVLPNNTQAVLERLVFVILESLYGLSVFTNPQNMLGIQVYSDPV